MRIRIATAVFICCALASASGQTPSSQAKETQKAPMDPARTAPRPPFKWWTIDKYRQELKLTGDQSQEIDRIFQASMDRLRNDKDDFDRAQTGFSELMQRPSVGEREFQRAVDQLELTRYNMNKERTTMLVRIHNVLTPDQRRGLEAIKSRNDASKNNRVDDTRKDSDKHR